MFQQNKKWFFVILVACVPALIAVFVVDWHFPKTGEGAREANKYDLLFLNTAVVNNDPSFCEKVYPAAYLTAAWNPSGKQVQYTKSECYWKIAVNTRGTSLCSKVKPVNMWFLNGSKMNEQSCREETQRFTDSGSKSTPHGGTFIAFVDLEGLFLELGYADDTIPEMYWNEYGSSRELVIRTYLDDIGKTEDFKERVQKLPSSTE